MRTFSRKVWPIAWLTRRGILLKADGEGRDVTPAERKRYNKTVKMERHLMRRKHPDFEPIKIAPWKPTGPKPKMKVSALTRITNLFRRARGGTPKKSPA